MPTPKRRPRPKHRSKAKLRRRHRPAAAKVRPQPSRRKPKRGSGKRKTKERASTFTDDGLVLICDIVDFSRLHHDLQAKAVERLWAYLKPDQKHALLADPKSYVVNGTGDGLMLAYFSSNTTTRHKQFMEFAAGMVKHMLAGDQKFHIRVGVNQGPFGFVHPSGCRTQQAVGTGINQCARIVAVGDSDTVTVAEDFVTKWSKRTGPEVQRLFLPPPGKPAHDVVIKRGEVFSLRFYAPEDGALKTVSKKIESFHVVRELIGRQLDAMEKALVGLLHKAQPALLETPLDIRISVLTERRHDHFSRVLCTTDYRHHAQGNGIKASSTVYPLPDSGEGTGPVGHAYAKNIVCVIHDLPDWLATDPAIKDEYYRQFVANRPYAAMARELVDGFSRHARAYLTFPFSLMKADPAKGLHPDGAVCIDIMQPLQGFTLEQLETFTAQLQSKYSDTLAQLWRLRGQL